MLYEMSNVVKQRSGLPVNVWISPKMATHGPRIKVQRNYGNNVTDDMFSITISDNPMVIGDSGEISSNDIKKVFAFIKLNKKLLLTFWNKEESDPVNILTNLTKV